MDRSKQGTKRSWCVEGGGMPVALSVAGANRNDCKLLEQTLQSFAQAKPKPTRAKPQHMLLDKGYDYAEVRAILPAHGLIAHIHSRGEEATAKQKQPGKKARRWVMERTHGWMNRFRSILTRWCKKERNCLGMLYFVCGLISYRAAGLFG